MTFCPHGFYVWGFSHLGLKCFSVIASALKHVQTFSP